ncbi:translational elongation factor EF-1 alpha [Fusarium falciforme]|nr:translational elongation factor EF-1 alpha [Fusarium falciforme]
MPTENQQSIKVLDELFQKLTVSKDSADIKESSNELASFINGRIGDQAVPDKVIEGLKKQLASKKDAAAREKACVAIEAIASHSEISAAVEPYLVVLLPNVLAAVGDKITAVKNAAQAAVLAIAGAINANAVKAALPAVMESIRNAQKWPEKMAALDFIDALVKSSPAQLAYRVPELIPVISESMWDTKKEVKERAYKAMEQLCQLIVNKDIERFIPELIKCIAKPENVPETVHLLGATTFVTEVQEPTLALMVPLLDRGLAERDTGIKRKSAVIVDNMCKLVDDPNIVAPFLPKMMPGLQKNYDNLADPEAREKTKQALDTLTRVGDIKDGVIPEARNDGAINVVLPKVKAAISPKFGNYLEKMGPVAEHIAAIAGQLVDEKETESTIWVDNLKAYVAVISGIDNAEALVESIRKATLPGAVAEAEAEEDEEEGEDLCNCTFSLAYGAKILLNQTHLRLKRGQRYGLCGPNGSGKSTLMRAINNEQVEGFPKQSEVKTVFVEHDLDSADTEMTTIDWTMKKLGEAGVATTEDDVKKQLSEFGFTDQMITGEITALSGGWKMKLALCRAVFEAPDILLLDEPTNHLDVKNVKWLEEYLINSPALPSSSLTTLASLTTSASTSFTTSASSSSATRVTWLPLSSVSPLPDLTTSSVPPRSSSPSPSPVSSRVSRPRPRLSCVPPRCPSSTPVPLSPRSPTSPSSALLALVLPLSVPTVPASLL